MIRRIPLGQMFVAMLVGVAGGLYIYRPLIEKHVYEQRQLKTDVKVTAVEENK
ncbi:PREDICTED: protein PIGBOS1 [Nanorana parkeri]|uniref:protein PIGBOS1 n=1 Tax=Nanorana parkeri TaxID=125878 RepID=UPI0008544A81|nr:PREDICTED: protein PIGBOS1 [Nanorana parkeri]